MDYKLISFQWAYIRLHIKPVILLYAIFRSNRVVFNNKRVSLVDKARDPIIFSSIISKVIYEEVFSIPWSKYIVIIEMDLFIKNWFSLDDLANDPISLWTCEISNLIEIRIRSKVWCDISIWDYLSDSVMSIYVKAFWVKWKCQNNVTQTSKKDDLELRHYIWASWLFMNGRPFHTRSWLMLLTFNQ